MKKILSFLCLLGLVGTLNAAPDLAVIPVTSVWSNGTHVASNALPVSGYIESIFVDLPGSSYTSTVVVATDRETLLTFTTISADTTSYPRLTPVTIANSTNAILVLTRPFLVREYLKATVTTTYGGTTTKDVIVYVKMNDK